MRVNGHFIMPPSISDMFNAHSDDVFEKLRVCAVGEIVSYNAEVGTVSVSLGEPTVTNNGSVVPNQTPLVDVPVAVVQGGGVHFGAPVQAGDECLIVFNDFNLGQWLQSGGQPAPEDSIRHALSGAIAIVCLNSGRNPLDTFLDLLVEGGVASALAKVSINKTTGLVTVANKTQNLAQIMQTLMTTLEAINTALGSMTTASIQSGTTQAAVAAQQAQLVQVATNLAELLA